MSTTRNGRGAIKGNLSHLLIMSRNTYMNKDITVGPSWETIAGWVAGVLGFISTAFVTAVYYWTQDRFNSVETHIKDHCGALDKQSERIAEQENKITRLDANFEHINANTTEIKDSIRRLHDKLDKQASG